MGGDVKEKEPFPKEFMTKEEYNLWLCSLDGIGSKKLKKILHNFPSAEAVFWAPKDCLENITGITKKDVHIIVESRKKYNPAHWHGKLQSCQMKEKQGRKLEINCIFSFGDASAAFMMEM